MTTDITRLPQFLAAVAALRGGFPMERVEEWAQRLAWNLDDLVALEAALPKAAPLTSPPVPQPGYSLARRPEPVERVSAGALAAKVRHGRARAIDIANRALTAAGDWQHAKMFVSLLEEDVLAQAAAIDAKVARGEDPGPLAGVPVAVKDLMAVQGYRLTGGTLARTPRLMDRDAPCVARLRRAGAIVFGVTNLHELAYGVTSANAHFGTVMNPRFPDRVPGGSSGGSGAVVAAGIVPIALGSDTGGSIRIPAACCGITGFKPTYGAVDTTDVLPLAWSLDHIGPLAACVDDAAVAFEVLAGLPEGSAGALSGRPPTLVALRGLFSEHVESGIARCLHDAEVAAVGAGARLREAAVDALRLAHAAQLVTIGTEAAEANADLLVGDNPGLSDEIRYRFELGRCFLASDYVKAQRIRREVRDALIEALGDADAIVVPTLPCVPPAVGQAVISVGGHARPAAGMLTRFTSPFNMTGLPALSIPCGFDESGLPASLQVVGRPGQDALVLSVGRWLEARMPRAAEPAHDVSFD